MPSRTGPRAAFLREARITLLLAIPLIVGQLCSMGQGVVEMLLAGHLDAHTLAAVAIGANVFMLPVMAAGGVMMAVTPCVAQLDGAGRRAEVPALFVQVLWLVAGLSVVLTAVSWFGGAALIGLVGVPASLAADAVAFLRAASLGMPAIVLYFAARGLAAGLSATRTAMVFALVGLLLLVPVGALLVYGGLGIPRLGAFGSGLSGAIVNSAQALAFYGWLRFGPSAVLTRPPGRARWRPDRAAILGLLRLGLPMAGSALLEVGAFTFAALAIGRFGEAAAASNQIALNVAAMAFMVPLGLSMAMTVRVGLAAGRFATGGGERAAMRRAGLAGLAIVLATQCAASGLMIAAPRGIAMLYTTDPEVVGGAASLLLLAGVFQFSDGIQVACGGALRGLKDARMPMAICFLAYWCVGIPLGLLLAFAADARAPGMWIGLSAGLTAAAGLLFARFMRLTRPVAAPAEAPMPA